MVQVAGAGREAMKMESSIRVYTVGTVRRVVTPAGTRVEPGDPLVELTAG